MPPPQKRRTRSWLTPATPPHKQVSEHEPVEQMTAFARTNFSFRGGSNPVWDRTHGNHMALELCPQAVAVSIAIWNANVMADDKIGEVILELEAGALKLGRKRLLPVDTGGQLEATIYYVPPPEPESPEAQPRSLGDAAPSQSIVDPLPDSEQPA